MKPLKEYVKQAEKQVVTTSVTITQAQLDWVRERNLNLSAFVRDQIDALIRTEMPQKKGGSK